MFHTPMPINLLVLSYASIKPLGRYINATLYASFALKWKFVCKFLKRDFNGVQ